MKNEAGKRAVTNEFFVFESKELPGYDKMFRPARSAHFNLYLLITGTQEIKVNLINYTMSKNSVIIIRPEVVHQIRAFNF